MAATARLHRNRRPTERREGSATVEFALVAPVLIVLLFGIIEFGLVYKDALAISQAAREGARSAAVGNPAATISARVTASAPGLTSANITVTSKYRTYSSGTWSGWTTMTPLTDSGGQNAATSGAQVQVTVSYPHTLVTGGLFSSLATPGTNYITLTTSMIMRRE